jgi:hypothetical protein
MTCPEALGMQVARQRMIHAGMHDRSLAEQHIVPERDLIRQI